MIINILAGGPVEHLPTVEAYDEENSIWVGVDRGVITLLNRGIIPHIAFGDFDSVTKDEMKRIQSDVKTMKIFHPEKDEPDMELALDWALAEKPSKIRLFGATGGRLDHFFSNVQLLLKTSLLPESCPIEIIDRQNTIFVKGPGVYQLEKCEQKKYISFIPQPPFVADLTLVGFKYPLNNRHIPAHSTLCISNELIGEYGTFSFTKGILLVIRSCD